MSVEAPTRPIIKTGEFYRIPVRAELFNPNEASPLHPRAKKTAEIILQTLEGNPPVEAGKISVLPEQLTDPNTQNNAKPYPALAVYRNGDKIFKPSEKIGERWFTIQRNGDVAERVSEIDPKEVVNAPAYLPGKNGEPNIPVMPNGDKKNKGTYFKLDDNGRPLKENGRPILIRPENPEEIVPGRRIDPKTGLEVTKVPESELVREKIREGITDLINLRCTDLIRKTAADPDSIEVIESWKNISEVTTAVVAIINNRSINSIQYSHALNMVDAGLQAATNPDYKIAFVAGFGASDSPYTTNRYPVNAVPALEMAANYQQYSKERQEQGKPGLQPPVVELVFAQEAGIHANYHDKADEVRAHMDRNIGNVRAFTEQLYPELDVKFVKDKPWESHDPVTKALIAYAADLIRNHQSPHIKSTLDKLVDFGEGKGTKESNAKTAIDYSGIHFMVWGDGSHIAPNTYFEGERPQVDTRVRVGSHSEKAFDAMSMVVLEQGSREDFQQFNRSQGEDIDIPEPTTRPPSLIYGITKYGEHGPSYFAKPFDREYGYPIGIEISELEKEVVSVKAKMSARAEEIKAPGVQFDQAAEASQFEAWAAEAADYNSSLIDLRVLSEVRARRAIVHA